ncbi:hypothetical protein ERO13_A02G045801v2, partial [Gossypium hirsutum]
NRVSFFYASEDGNLFFVWRSLYAAKQLVGNGFWWCVGDGASIQVFNDPWLNNEATFYVEKVPIEGLEELYVKMLMTEDGMGWDRSFDEGVLSPHDVAHVFSIPIGRHMQPD